MDGNDSDLSEEYRREREKSLLWATAFGIFLRLFVIAIEFLGYYFFASYSLLMDAVASCFDTLSSVCLLFFIRAAARPPDKNHPFGHGRFEPIAGFQLGLILVLFGAVFALNHILRFTTGEAAHPLDERAWFVALVATLFLEICYRVTHKIALKQNSAALISESFHYRIDALTSLIAFSALSAAYFLPDLASYIDDLGAFVIAVLMIVLGAVAAKRNFRQLTDHRPKKDYFRKIERIVLAVKGVEGIKKILIQQYGPDAQVNIEIEVQGFLTVNAGHAIAERAKEAIKRSYPEVRDVSAHIEPKTALSEKSGLWA